MTGGRPGGGSGAQRGWACGRGDRRVRCLRRICCAPPAWLVCLVRWALPDRCWRPSRSGVSLRPAAAAQASPPVTWPARSAVQASSPAAVTGSPALLFVGLFVYGAGTSTNLQARYAGADLATPAHRARAVSTVLVATTLGGVVGPNLAAPTGDLAASLGIPYLAGPFLLAGAAYATGRRDPGPLAAPRPVAAWPALWQAPPRSTPSRATPQTIRQAQPQYGHQGRRADHGAHPTASWSRS